MEGAGVSPRTSHPDRHCPRAHTSSNAREMTFTPYNTPVPRTWIPRFQHPSAHHLFSPSFRSSSFTSGLPTSPLPAPPSPLPTTLPSCARPSSHINPDLATYKSREQDQPPFPELFLPSSLLFPPLPPPNGAASRPRVDMASPPRRPTVRASRSHHHRSRSRAARQHAPHG